MAPPPPVSLKVVNLLLRVLTAIFLVISVIVLTTNSVTIGSIKFHFNDVYAYRYMLAAAVIGLIYAVIQLIFTICQFATGVTNSFTYQLDFYGDKLVSYLVATGSAAGFGVTKDLKDAFIALVALDSTDPVDEFFSKGYASASLLLFAFLCLAVLSVFSVVLLSLRVLTVAFLVITVIILSTNSVTIVSQGNSLKFHFKDVYAYRYMFSAAIIGLLYAVIQLFFSISELATRTKNPFNYQLDFYGDKIISYLVATGSAAGFGVTKDLKDTFLALVVLDSTDPVDKLFSRGYASASMLLFAFFCLAVLSVFSSHTIAKHQLS
ncbi:unnamed protein product [Brassica napus]|uniref:CASP-like protein n=1 Tax=Brassica napus TaxID=3708 RepID=A0A817ARZ7_BRANA|nr:unnamed protein product [Brassica napus]